MTPGFGPIMMPHAGAPFGDGRARAGRPTAPVQARRPQDLPRCLLTAVMLVVVVVSGGADFVRGEWGRAVVKGVLATVVVATVLTLTRLTERHDA